MLQCLHALAVKTEALLNEGRALAPQVRDFRLGLEVAVIQTFADKIVAMLKAHDPLSERVHLSPFELLVHSFGAMAGETARRAVGRRAQSKTAAGA
jgi:hydroxysqualene synthase